MRLVVLMVVVGVRQWRRSVGGQGCEIGRDERVVALWVRELRDGEREKKM